MGLASLGEVLSPLLESDLRNSLYASMAGTKVTVSTDATLLLLRGRWRLWRGLEKGSPSFFGVFSLEASTTVPFSFPADPASGCLSRFSGVGSCFTTAAVFSPTTF